jgi:hypothetical protein
MKRHGEVSLGERWENCAGHLQRPCVSRVIGTEEQGMSADRDITMRDCRQSCRRPPSLELLTSRSQGEIGLERMWQLVGN